MQNVSDLFGAKIEKLKGNMHAGLRALTELLPRTFLSVTQGSEPACAFSSTLG